jgi:hypothetical protein
MPLPQRQGGQKCHALRGQSGEREFSEAFAVMDDRVGQSLRDRGPGLFFRNVTIKRAKLLSSLRCIDDGVSHHFLAVAASCSAASLALTSAVDTARDGSAFSAS